MLLFPDIAPPYAASPTTHIAHAWITWQLPCFDPTAVQHLVQLVSGLLDHQSVVIEEIARGRTFRANAERNPAQVRRIPRDSRLSLERLSYPLVR